MLRALLLSVTVFSVVHSFAQSPPCSGYPNETPGCTSPCALNYDANATCDNSGCIFSEAALSWENTLGGDFLDQASITLELPSDELLVAGYSSSGQTGDLEEGSIGGSDVWVLRLNSNGTVQWQNRFGGASAEFTNCAIAANDGGFLVGSSSSSDAGEDKSENSFGGSDFWLVKLDASGQIEWDRTYGGSGDDWFSQILPSPTGGYYLVGFSESNASGLKSEDSRGGDDYWVIRVDQSGNVLWDRTFGGSDQDFILDAVIASDGGMLLPGISYSDASGEKSVDSKGESDFWVVKVNENGNIEWDRTYGGESFDDCTSVCEAVDGGYILAGTSRSAVSGDVSEAASDLTDLWVLKLNVTGELVWQNMLQAPGTDTNPKLTSSPEGGFYLASQSNSGISQDKSEDSRGGFDFWVIKLSYSGFIEWDRLLGGTDNEYQPIISITSWGGICVTGASESGIGFEKSEVSQGFSDYWVVRLALPFASGCDDPAACNYNSAADCGGSGSCFYPSGCDTCTGGIDGEGILLDGDTNNNGICDSEEQLGCIYSAACNYDATATIDDGSCFYPAPGRDCSNTCLTDVNNNGICDFEEASGCTYPDALNFNPEVSLENGSCVFPCGGDLNIDGLINTVDLLILLGSFGTLCQ